MGGKGSEDWSGETRILDKKEKKALVITCADKKGSDRKYWRSKINI